ncbi:alpha-ketoglutarate permease [Bacillus paramycoides]|uniref:alpha-ketoglutarate permease n=1 Tax=Bacillus paramycoides TaxID=2026194 RepID=UPI003D02C3F2
MFKTLLAGTLLSTGLLAGGAVGAEDAENVKMDNLKSNENSPNQSITTSADGTTSFSQNFNAPKDAVPATPKGDAKTVERTEGTGSQEGKMVPTKEGTDSQPGFEMGAPEKPEHAKTVERTEGTDSQEGKMVPTKEGN